jgi:tRNA A-37 threonylcarbamoyl transferase component Bud32
MIRKDNEFSRVYVGFDGRVRKTFRGLNAQKRFETEVAVLKHLEARGCEYVPRLLEVDPETLTIVTSNCGQRATSISEGKAKELFAELERDYGVRHEDAFPRNITYRHQDGRFCVIDFEFASLVDENGELLPGGVSLKVPGKE